MVVGFFAHRTQHSVHSFALSAFSLVLLSLLGCQPEGVEVPNVVRSERTDAEARIENCGLVVGETTYEFSSSIAEGLILSQMPAAETRVEKGSPVAIVVSRGTQIEGTAATQGTGGSDRFFVYLAISGVLAFIVVKSIRPNAFRRTYIPAFKVDRILWLLTMCALVFLMYSCIG